MRPYNFVGNTPLLRAGRFDNIYAKFEVYNPSGSIKDRMVSWIINKAELDGVLKPGDVVVEATSGNTGIAIALISAERGYRAKIIMPSDMSDERKSMLKLMGAELIEVGPGDFDGAIKLRDSLVSKNGWFSTMQFSNTENIRCHYKTTGPEILRQANSVSKKIKAFVSGTGTGGTIMGVGRFLKENCEDVKIIAVEPSESPVMSGGEPGLHGIQGIGDGSKFLVDMGMIDQVITISTNDAKGKASSLIRDEGILAGISSGANILASERWIVDNNEYDGIVVTTLCDRGERYLSCM